MEKTLGQLLRDERTKRGWSLRDVEEKTEIHNAHLSQIESGAIARPAPNLLFTLAALYDMRYEKLMQLGGHMSTNGANGRRRSVQGAALSALDELTPTEQRQTLEFMKRLRGQRTPDG